jgi:hypothetical protein
VRVQSRSLTQRRVADAQIAWGESRRRTFACHTATPTSLENPSRGFGGASRRLRIVALGATALVLAGAGVTYASTKVFGHNQVGTQYANGIQVSDDQIIKPLGDRLLTQFGKFMGSTVSPDGRFVAATSADKSVVLQIFDLSSYKLIWTVGSASGVNQKLTDGTVGQVGPTYSPDGKFLWLPEQNGLTRFPDHRRSTASSRFTPRRVMRQIPFGSSTAPSIR